MIQLLAPIISSALAPTLAASSVPALASLGTLLSKPIIGSALTSGIASLLGGDDIGDALKSAAIGGVGGAIGLGGETAAGSRTLAGDIAKVAQEQGSEAAKKLLIEREGGIVPLLTKGIGGLTGDAEGKGGLLSPQNLILASMFMPQAEAEEPEPHMGGGYYGPGMTYVPASRVLKRAEGGRIVGPGTPTSDSIPATIYQDGIPVGEAALSTQEVVLSHKDLAALDPNGDYEKVSEMIGNTKNGDRGKAAAELFLKMQKA